MIERQPISTRTDTTVPYTQLFRAETAEHGNGEAPPLLDDLAVLEHEVGEGEHAGDGDERGGVRAAVQGLAQVVDARRAVRLHHEGADDRGHHAHRRDRKSTRLNSSHYCAYRMPYSD